MKKTSITLSFTALIYMLPFFALADVRSEINIDANGKMTAKNIRVFTVPDPGKSKFFYTRATWDNVFIRMTVLTSDATVITKQYGEKATVFDIKEGDIINVEGFLPNSADSLNIQATKIVDTSLLIESKETSGTVTSVNAGASNFILTTQKGNVITVGVEGATITKGVRTISISDIAKGDNILLVKGTFDFGTYNMDATSVIVYQDKSIFKPHNFEGMLKSISGATLPVTLTVFVGNKDYAVFLDEKSTVLNRAKKRVGLTRFVVGDTVRFYGAIRQTDLSSIDADTVRNLNF